MAKNKKFRNRWTYIIMFMVCISSYACSKDPISHNETGYATGKVTNSAGNPMEGVEITVENTLIGDHIHGTTFTDNQGFYKIKVTQIGTFHTSAYATKTLNGKQYKLALHPDNDEPFGNEGGLRNFKWTLTGQKPTTTEGFYGATIELSNEPGFYIDEEKIEFTLTPVGTLIDGSEGSVLRLKSGLPQTATYGYLVDIPLGKYRVTAIYKNGTINIPLKLKKRDSDQAYADNTIVEFEQAISTGTPTAGLSYKD